MKKMIYSFVLVSLMLIGTSVSLFGQDWLFHADPPKTRVWESEVFMKAPPHLVDIAIKWVEEDPPLIFTPGKLVYSGYSLNQSFTYEKYNKDNSNPPNESCLFCIIFVSEFGAECICVITGTGDVVDWLEGIGDIKYDGQQFEHP